MALLVVYNIEQVRNIILKPTEVKKGNSKEEVNMYWKNDYHCSLSPAQFVLPGVV